MRGRVPYWIGAAVLVLALESPLAAATEIQRVRSPGGIEAWLVEDRSIPVISFRFAFKGGGALDPVPKQGLANMVSALLDEGAGELDSRAFQEALDDIVAGIGFDAGVERFHGSLRTLSEHRQAAFALLRMALAAPRFDAEPVERIRRQIVAGLENSKDNPGRLAGRAWYRLVFGDHPYARPLGGTPETVAAVTVEDLRRFVRDRLVREGLIVGVAGDISPAELARRLDEVFGALPASGSPAALPEPAPRGGTLKVIRRPIPQSVVVFGQVGLTRDDPDFYAAYVMNHVLAVGRSSRLNQEIREKRGLVYSVSSHLAPFDKAGLIVGRLATANARVETALDLLRAEWGGWRATGRARTKSSRRSAISTALSRSASIRPAPSPACWWGSRRTGSASTMSRGVRR